MCTDSADRPADEIIRSPEFQEATVAFLESCLGDRIPPNWPILPIFVERYIEELLLPAIFLGSGVSQASVRGYLESQTRDQGRLSLVRV